VADLTTEIKALSARREFGLNFERHIPETVELPGRPGSARHPPERRVAPSCGVSPTSRSSTARSSTGSRASPR
jgi:adenine-specific DNA-methyltransferase